MKKEMSKMWLLSLAGSVIGFMVYGLAIDQEFRVSVLLFLAFALVVSITGLAANELTKDE